MSFIHSFIHQWLYRPGLFFSFVIFFAQMVGLLGRVISPPQGRYLHTGQHKHIINAHTDIHALSGIRTHELSVRASEESSCLRQRGHCDRHYVYTEQHKYIINAHVDIHALSGIRTHDLSVRASEESSCLRQRGHCDRLPCLEGL
jgi:hypothetical protein